jgi:L-iditol 2-dehydrogenase
MLALRLHPGGELRSHDEPVPEPGPGDALVRVTAVGLCGSDRHWVVDGGIGDATLDRPLVLGHEFAGVAESGKHRGRLVAVDPAVSCEDCEACRAGAPNLCLRIRFAGHGREDGALRELIGWPERCLVPLPDTLDDAQGALVEPLAVAVHALDLAGRLRGATVGVLGCGPIGLLIAGLARTARAASVVAADPLAHRREAAMAMGATAVVEATPERDEVAAIVAASSGGGLDVVFEASGEQRAVDSAIDAVRAGGQVILVGIPAEDRTSFAASVARRKGLTLKLSRRSTPYAFRRAARLAQRRSVDLASLVTLRVPLHDAQRGFDALVSQAGIKVIVEPGARA